MNKADEKMFELLKIAFEIVLIEDKKLFEELAQR